MCEDVTTVHSLTRKLTRNRGVYIGHYHTEDSVCSVRGTNPKLVTFALVSKMIEHEDVPDDCSYSFNPQTNEVSICWIEDHHEDHDEDQIGPRVDKYRHMIYTLIDDYAIDRLVDLWNTYYDYTYNEDEDSDLAFTIFPIDSLDEFYNGYAPSQIARMIKDNHFDIDDDFIVMYDGGKLGTCCCDEVVNVIRDNIDQIVQVIETYPESFEDIFEDFS